MSGRSAHPTRLAHLALVSVLLLPWTGAARAARAEAPCHVAGPDLGVDVERACVAVRSVVPAWDGRATVTTADGDPNVAAESLGRGVVVHPAVWAVLSPAGRQEVLTHELVHVATDDVTTTRTPQWLVEGLAEAVGLRGTRLPDAAVLQELRAAVAKRGLPRALPTGAVFAATPAVAYEQSWLAADLLLQRYGGEAVLAFYRAAGHRPLAQALAPLGLTPPQLTALWRAELVRRLS